jgi:hydrogenase maturation protease
LGTWPILVGDEEMGERDTMLSSPIILYDYPRIAPESTGPLFDGTEIDEILALRILTMTDAEKAEMRNVDVQARRLLERMETMPQDSLLKMHGRMSPADSAGVRGHTASPSESSSKKDASGSSALPIPMEPQLSSSVSGSPPPEGQGSSSIEFDDFFKPHAPIESVSVGGVRVRGGDRVRIHPKGRADLLDMALDGRTAIVEAIEQDAERRIHLALVLEDDPGKDLGMLRQPGHRFFYAIEEIEPLPERPK